MNMNLGKCTVTVKNSENFIEITKNDSNKVTIINKQKVILIEETEIKQGEFEFIVQLDGSIYITFQCYVGSASKIESWIYNI